MIFHKAVFAVIYLNLEQPNRYNINDPKERNDAKALFARRVKYDNDRLNQALQIYNQMQAKETEQLFAEWLAK